jgi:hypothetical protein
MIQGSRAILCSLLLACSGREAKHVGLQSSQPDTHVALNAGATNTQRADSVPHYCARGVSPIRISEDSVGPLDLWMTLRSLRTLCPAARDTVLYGSESSSPALAFSFEGLTAVALQYQDSLLPDQPPDAWSVQGANGVLLGHLSLAAPWAEFRDALGPAIASGAGTSIDDNRITVVFCGHQRLFVILQAPSNSVEDQSKDLSRIPSSATIQEVEIFPQPNPTWSC